MIAAPLTDDERARAKAIAATVDLTVPLPDPEIGDGAAWLATLHRRNLAAIYAELVAMEADESTAEARVERCGRGWSVRCLGKRETFPTLFPTKKVATAMAQQNATTAYEGACGRLREALGFVAGDTTEETKGMTL